MNYIKTISLLFNLFIYSAIVQATNYSISDFGAQPNDGAADTKAIQQAIDKCSEEGIHSTNPIL